MTKYAEGSISYFKTDLEKIRAKPQMFIGPTDNAGIFTIIREPSDNAVDEARAGRNKLIHIFAEKEGVYWIVDQGVGIPVKMHPEAKVSTLTHVLTALQSSGKMKGDAYTSAIGTHGVGIKATNALSKEFDVWTYRKDAGGWHHTRFERGVEKSKPKKVAAAPKLPDGSKPKLGTVVRFVPDEKIFLKAKLEGKQLMSWCEMTAYMNAGLTIKLTNPMGKTQTWFSKVGIAEYLDKRMALLRATPLNRAPVFATSPTMELALSFADVEGSEVQFFTNTIRNIDEGFHADSFYKALTKSLEPFKGKLVYTPTDLKDGLVGVLNYKIDAPQFSSQTKEKLVDVRMKEPCYAECLAIFAKYFTANKTLAKQIVNRAALIRAKTASLLKDKKLIKNVKSASRGLSAKLADVSGNKVPVLERELYLVEGDSAGGCHFGDTRVLLADGGTKTFEQLVEDFANGIDNRCVAYDRTNGKARSFEIFHPRITKKVKEYVELELEDDTVWRGTTDHPWLLTTGKYKAAGELNIDDEIQEIPRQASLSRKSGS